jgi:diaminopimelate epimerase
VHMPGGVLKLEFTEDFFVTMTGPATRVARLEPDAAALQQIP